MFCDAYIFFIYIIISIAFRKCTLEQNLAHMHREILNHNIHIIHVHLLALIKGVKLKTKGTCIANCYNNTRISKVYVPFLINHHWEWSLKGAHRGGHSMNSNSINTIIHHWIMINSVWADFWVFYHFISETPLLFTDTYHSSTVRANGINMLK